MPDGVLAILGPIGVAIGAALSYLGLRRRQSGTIDTSEAADLWSQTKVIIHALGQRADTLQSQVDLLMQRVDTLTQINDSLRQERALLQHEVSSLTESNRALGERVTDLTKALEEHRRQLSLPSQ